MACSGGVHRLWTQLWRRRVASRPLSLSLAPGSHGPPEPSTARWSGHSCELWERRRPSAERRWTTPVLGPPAQCTRWRASTSPLRRPGSDARLRHGSLSTHAGPIDVTRIRASSLHIDLFCRSPVTRSRNSSARTSPGMSTRGARTGRRRNRATSATRRRGAGLWRAWWRCRRRRIP